MAYVHRVVKAGPCVEHKKMQSFRVHTKGVKRGPNTGHTTEKQERINERVAEEHLRWDINANFGHRDLHAVLGTDIRCVHGQRELVAGKQRKIKKAHADQKPGATCLRFSAQQQEYEQHRRCRKQKQKQMRPAKGRNRKFVHFTRRNVFPVFSSRNRLNSSTVPPVRVRLSRGCA